MPYLLRTTALLFVAVAAMGYQRGAPRMAPPPERGGARRGGPIEAPKEVPRRLANPANPVARLYRASPEERERALEKLPPAQQERFRRNLQWFDSLPKRQQD